MHTDHSVERHNHLHDFEPMHTCHDPVLSLQGFANDIQAKTSHIWRLRLPAIQHPSVSCDNVPLYSLH